MVNWIGLVVLLLSLGNTAHADIMIEPWLGYEMGKSKCTTVADGNCSGDITATAYGLRLGYKSMIGLWVAGEYDGDSGGSFSADDTTVVSSGDTKHTSLGVTAGFDIIMGLRVFAGYNFKDQLDVTSAGTTTKFTGGNSIKIGAGYKLPLIPLAFNFEIFQGSYKKYDDGTNSGDVDTIYSTFKSSAYILSVSAPLSF